MRIKGNVSFEKDVVQCGEVQWKTGLNTYHYGVDFGVALKPLFEKCKTDFCVLNSVMTRLR